MVFLSGLSNAISSACSAIGGALSSVGSGICNFAQNIIMPFPELIPAITVIKVIATVVSFLAEAFGVTTKEDKPDELGAKAAQCEKKAEDFESTEKYIEYLRNEVKLDMEKFDKLSSEEKLGYTALGVSIITKAIEEKERVSIPVEFLHEVAKQRLTGPEVKTFMESFRNSGLSDMKDMSDYLKNGLGFKESQPVGSAMADALKKLNPDMSESDIQDKIVEMKLMSRNSEGM